MLDMAKITIGEKDYVLRFPLSAMVKAERLIEKPLHVVFTPKQGQLPDYTLEQLILLFKIGLKAEHKDISDEKAEELLVEYLSEGESILQQSTTLYLILGKALGFFRTEMDIQTEIEKKMSMPRNPLKK
jgi:hypothetical protein